MAGPYRILIIEDDPEHAELIKMGFRRHDEFFLNFAATGENGLEMISQDRYDLISVDLVLPGIGGLDVLVRIRRLDPDIPVVMVSCHGTTEMAVVAFENRATKYVVKSLESFKSLPYVFENLIQEARFKASERQMRECIERSERIHRNVVENALAGIYILQEGVFKLVNPRLGEIFGCSADSLLGMPFWQLITPDDIQCAIRLEKDRQSGVPIYESRVLRKDGTCRWIEFRTMPIEHEGQRAVLGNLLDITDRKEREIEILRANRELEAMDRISEIFFSSKEDLDKVLADSLAFIVSGAGGADVGGIFLQENRGLVLRALHGSVEVLIEFVNDIQAGCDLLGKPLVHEVKDGSRGSWISAPIISGAQKKGALVLACEELECLHFLERASLRIGYILDRSEKPPTILSENEIEVMKYAW